MPMNIKFFKKSDGVVRGRSAAFIITVSVHVALLIGAMFYTAMTVLKQKEPAFEGKDIVHPKMDPKKLQVPVSTKKFRPPKASHATAMPTPQKINISMPTMNVKGGSDFGDGFGSLGFPTSFDLMGMTNKTPNTLVGTYYDLKMTPDRMPVIMDEEIYAATLRNFVDRSWNTSVLEAFFQAPGKKYTPALMLPTMGADVAPTAFKVSDVSKPSYWVVHYKGEMCAPESGNFRFVGLGDDVLVVRANKKVVLDACWPVMTGLQQRAADASRASYGPTTRRVTNWESKAPETGLFPLVNRVAYYGDWIPLRKGERVPIEILLGESPGGEFSCALLIEQEGKAYQKLTVPAGTVGGLGGSYKYPGGTRNILPVFKLADIPESMRAQMKIDEKEATFDGPSFGNLK
jgi:hypothetical protein